MKTINFKQSWHEAIAQFDAAVRCEIYGATAAYSLEGIVPEGMSDLARGAFAFIKADIDASRRRAEKARAARLARANARAASAQAAQLPAVNEPEIEEEKAPDAVADAPEAAAPEPCPDPGVPHRRSRKPATRRAARRQNAQKCRRRTFTRALERRIRALKMSRQ